MRAMGWLMQGLGIAVALLGAATWDALLIFCGLVGMVTAYPFIRRTRPPC
jgi:hypothetical protein